MFGASSRFLRFFPVQMLTVLSMGACTLSVSAPLYPPPEEWDRNVNTHPAGSEFQELLDNYVSRGLPGVVLLISTSEGYWSGAAGFAKIETRDPMLPNHRFHAASITKMYTATAVLLLAEEGRIELDREIKDYLPESVWRPIPNGDKATVRQLLGHTSGIPDFSGSLHYDLDTFNDPLGDFPPRRMLGYLHGQSAIFRPGEGYFYSNANYLLLALLLDEVTGRSHADLISEAILQPLGLSATFYKNEPGYPEPAGLVNSYQDLTGNGELVNGSDLAVHSTEGSVGYAGIIATAEDYAAFLEGLLGGELLGPELLGEMQTPTRSPRYGLGLSLMETPFGTAIGHSGGSFGIQSQVRRFPDSDATLVLLSNGGDGGAPAELFQRLWEEVMALAL